MDDSKKTRVILTAAAARLKNQELKKLKDKHDEEMVQYYRKKYKIQDPDFLLSMVCCPFCPRKFLSIQALKYHHLHLHEDIEVSKLTKMLSLLEGENLDRKLEDLGSFVAAPDHDSYFGHENERSSRNSETECEIVKDDDVISIDSEDDVPVKKQERNSFNFLWQTFGDGRTVSPAKRKKQQNVTISNTRPVKTIEILDSIEVNDIADTDSSDHELMSPLERRGDSRNDDSGILCHDSETDLVSSDDLHVEEVPEIAEEPSFSNRTTKKRKSKHNDTFSISVSALLSKKRRKNRENEFIPKATRKIMTKKSKQRDRNSNIADAENVATNSKQTDNNESNFSIAHKSDTCAQRDDAAVNLNNGKNGMALDQTLERSLEGLQSQFFKVLREVSPVNVEEVTTINTNVEKPTGDARKTKESHNAQKSVSEINEARRRAKDMHSAILETMEPGISNFAEVIVPGEEDIVIPSVDETDSSSTPLILPRTTVKSNAGKDDVVLDSELGSETGSSHSQKTIPNLIQDMMEDVLANLNKLDKIERKRKKKRGSIDVTVDLTEDDKAENEMNENTVEVGGQVSTAWKRKSMKPKKVKRIKDSVLENMDSIYRNLCSPVFMDTESEDTEEQVNDGQIEDIVDTEERTGAENYDVFNLRFAETNSGTDASEQPISFVVVADAEVLRQLNENEPQFEVAEELPIVQVEKVVQKEAAIPKLTLAQPESTMIRFERSPPVLSVRGRSEISVANSEQTCESLLNSDAVASIPGSEISRTCVPETIVSRSEPNVGAPESTRVKLSAPTGIESSGTSMGGRNKSKADFFSSFSLIAGPSIAAEKPAANHLSATKPAAGAKNSERTAGNASLAGSSCTSEPSSVVPIHNTRVHSTVESQSRIPSESEKSDLANPRANPQSMETAKAFYHKFVQAQGHDIESMIKLSSSDSQIVTVCTICSQVLENSDPFLAAKHYASAHFAESRRQFVEFSQSQPDVSGRCDPVKTTSIFCPFCGSRASDVVTMKLHYLTCHMDRSYDQFLATMPPEKPIKMRRVRLDPPNSNRKSSGSVNTYSNTGSAYSSIDDTYLNSGRGVLEQTRNAISAHLSQKVSISYSVLPAPKNYGGFCARILSSPNAAGVTPAVRNCSPIPPSQSAGGPPGPLTGPAGGPPGPLTGPARGPPGPLTGPAPGPEGSMSQNAPGPKSAKRSPLLEELLDIPCPPPNATNLYLTTKNQAQSVNTVPSSSSVQKDYRKSWPPPAHERAQLPPPPPYSQSVQGLHRLPPVVSAPGRVPAVPAAPPPMWVPPVPAMPLIQQRPGQLPTSAQPWVPEQHMPVYEAGRLPQYNQPFPRFRPPPPFVPVNPDATELVGNSVGMSSTVSVVASEMPSITAGTKKTRISADVPCPSSCSRVPAQTLPPSSTLTTTANHAPAADSAVFSADSLVRPISEQIGSAAHEPSTAVGTTVNVDAREPKLVISYVPSRSGKGKHRTWEESPTGLNLGDRPSGSNCVSFEATPTPCNPDDRSLGVSEPRSKCSKPKKGAKKGNIRNTKQSTSEQSKSTDSFTDPVTFDCPYCECQFVTRRPHAADVQTDLMKHFFIKHSEKLFTEYLAYLRKVPAFAKVFAASMTRSQAETLRATPDGIGFADNQVGMPGTVGSNGTHLPANDPVITSKNIGASGTNALANANNLVTSRVENIALHTSQLSEYISQSCSDLTDDSNDRVKFDCPFCDSWFILSPPFSKYVLKDILKHYFIAHPEKSDMQYCNQLLDVPALSKSALLSRSEKEVLSRTLPDVGQTDNRPDMRVTASTSGTQRELDVRVGMPQTAGTSASLRTLDKRPGMPTAGTLRGGGNRDLVNNSSICPPRLGVGAQSGSETVSRVVDVESEPAAAVQLPGNGVVNSGANLQAVTVVSGVGPRPEQGDSSRSSSLNVVPIPEEETSPLLKQMETQAKMLEENFQLQQQLLDERLEQHENMIRKKMKQVEEHQRIILDMSESVESTVKEEVIEVKDESEGESDDDMHVLKPAARARIPPVVDSIEIGNKTVETETVTPQLNHGRDQTDCASPFYEVIESGARRQYWSQLRVDPIKIVKARSKSKKSKKKSSKKPKKVKNQNPVTLATLNKKSMTKKFDDMKNFLKGYQKQ